MVIRITIKRIIIAIVSIIVLVINKVKLIKRILLGIKVKKAL